MNKIIVCVFILSISCFASWPIVAAEAEQKGASHLPITIKSNDLTADNKGKIATFSGKVVAKQGDVTIYCDRMTVYYGAVQGDVDKIEAEGNVRIVQANRIGQSSLAIYESREGRITLTGGSPKVTQGSDTVTGKIITYYIDDDRSEVRGEGDRVEAVIHPKTRKDPQQRKGNAGQR